ncbi:hypothetical protein Q7C36_022457 [Tachysurus vachellii]|uniref:Uncharacterized protein n=1 Tax=Tachysurus vachellii TaxID=175792 RepID=A0AA88ILE1_TACVA|nr:hypothetical protein Q7C36_022457 [Tachysurus vachellii]
MVVSYCLILQAFTKEEGERSHDQFSHEGLFLKGHPHTSRSTSAHTQEPSSISRSKVPLHVHANSRQDLVAISINSRPAEIAALKEDATRSP